MTEDLFGQVAWFAPVCKRELDSFFEQNRYDAWEHPGRSLGVAYRASGLFAYVFYYPEDRPRYAVMVAVGVVAREGVSSQLDGTHLSAVSNEQLDHVSLTFSDEAELAAACAYLRGFLGRCPNWRDRDLVTSVAGALAIERDRDYSDRETSRQLELARKAFADQRWQEALDSYVVAGTERLIDADQKRLSIARRNLRG